ncbi:MAG TPA: hypothetical protein VFX15_07325, partial [Actinomycetes bacterium]|nr:hypothetical protein [Actinomycetes bacterium]
TAGTDPTWIPRVFPEYEQSSVVYEAYDARRLDQGAYFVVAFPGPYEEIPDLSIMSEDRVDIGFVRCGSMVLHPEGKEPVETDGHVCFRTSGDYSVSVLATSLDMENTAALVDEFWALQ